jgi:hypothetical protein
MNVSRSGISGMASGLIIFVLIYLSLYPNGKKSSDEDVNVMYKIKRVK